MRTIQRSLLRALAALAFAWLAGCASVPGGSPVRLDETRRIAVISAFQPELTLLLTRVQDARKYSVNGVEFTTGTLQGQPVVVFLSGISMVNAAMNTQLVLDRFNVSSVVFSGIAGGVNPGLHIGDVTVPAQWGQYLEVVMARETAPGKYSIPPFLKDEAKFPNYGMLHPMQVKTRRAGQATPSLKFWFEADPRMLEVARGLRNVDLANCAPNAKCLSHKPQLVVGGNGVSGQAFVDNASFREYAFKTFQANVLDMETAATAMAAYSNGVPYIAFRSLSDLAGGGEGENEMGTFMNVAADNSAKVLLAFLASWKP